MARELHLLLLLVECSQTARKGLVGLSLPSDRCVAYLLHGLRPALGMKAMVISPSEHTDYEFSSGCLRPFR